ncbi:MAG: lipid-A-disaccharide synthase [Legionella sp.]|jgi:lipid-A-disaccharide synthase
MPKAKHIVIIAGEESGDMHAAQLIKQLHNQYPKLRISGIGGNHMQAAGAQLIADLARFGVTGFTEVLKHLFVIRKALKDIKAHLCEQKPDLLILVDYPGFNLRLAKFAKRELGLKIVYYISPQIWAWKPKRIHLIKECVDKMAVILPFEKAIYENAQVPVSFVGHPLVDKITPYQMGAAHRKALELPIDAHIIALLPGSRKNEIEKHMPVLRDTALLIHQQLPNTQFVLPIAGTIDPRQIQKYFAHTKLPIHLVPGKSLECMAAANLVLVASGTASLECALLNKPMGIFYKSSFLTYHLAMKFVRVRFLGLCNLLTNTMLVPEFLQYDCNAKELARFVLECTNNPGKAQAMIKRLEDLKHSLSAQKSDCSLLDLVVNELA